MNNARIKEVYGNVIHGTFGEVKIQIFVNGQFQYTKHNQISICISFQKNCNNYIGSRITLLIQVVNSVSVIQKLSIWHDFISHCNLTMVRPWWKNI